jgi:transposase InsO family protein
MIAGLVDEATRGGARREAAVEALGLSVRTVQRWRHQADGADRRRGPHTAPSNKLTPAERDRVLGIANAPAFRDLSPQQIVPRLADQGDYIASESTFYRVLREEGQLTHRAPSRPATSRRPREHVATGPCQVWSWDITYLKSPISGQFFYLYLILDVWSRKIVAATVHGEESNEHASRLFVQACRRLGLDPDGLVLHSDNGGPMKGATMLATLQNLGVVASFSRPRVSDDNPYSEALFRTLKYRPGFPSQPFASLKTAQGWVDGFVAWYNTEHLHSAIRFITPDDRHFGREAAILAQRQLVYEQAQKTTPERWAQNTRNWQPVEAVYLNPSARREQTPLRDVA